MTDHSAAAVAGITPAPGARLQPDAIGAAQDTIIGMASSAPAATAGLTFAGLAGPPRSLHPGGSRGSGVPVTGRGTPLL